MMGLYLAIFDDDHEVDGVEVGSYSFFGELRDAVVKHLEAGAPGTRFPAFILHPDSDGEYSPEEAGVLARELEVMGTELRNIPAGRGHPRGTMLSDLFVDVDGEPLLVRMRDLAIQSARLNLPILFQ